MTSTPPLPINNVPPLSPQSTAAKEPERTNTLALVLPHPFLFTPHILGLLRKHYEQYGELYGWAPVRAFGRVILVYVDEDGAMRAKREGDRLVIGGSTEGSETKDGEYFPADGSVPTLTLRLYLSASTDILPPSDPSLHLEPPPLTKNFLISPPGSPPEGWEPILEDPPNSNTLAADLMKALAALDFDASLSASASRVAKGEVATVVEGEGDAEGMRVTVQDMTPGGDDDDSVNGDEDDGEIFESAEGLARHRAGKISMIKAGVESMGGSSDGARTPGGSLFGVSGHDAFTPSGRIQPTPMPPRP